MGKSESILGHYDMVMALWEGKINQGFELLFDQEDINEDWSFMAKSTDVNSFLKGEAVKNMIKQKKDIQNDLEAFKTAADDYNEGDEEEKKKGKKEIERITAKYKLEFKGKCSAVRKSLEKIQKKLEKYDLAMTANIKSPVIKILKSKDRTLLLMVRFETGKIYYWSSSDSYEYSLKDEQGDGYTYAFEVSLAKNRVTDLNEKVWQQKNGEFSQCKLSELLTDKQTGIKPEHFTVEKLFMDFQNANISKYDQKESNLPKGSEKNLALPAALASYFRNLAKTDHPYIFGYQVENIKLKKSPSPLLLPTAMRYSKSYSSKKVRGGLNSSSFNFLMMTNGESVPERATAGVLDSLLEQSKTFSSDAHTHGVFAVKKAVFQKNVLPALWKEIRSKAIKHQLFSQDSYCQSDGLKLKMTDGRAFFSEKNLIFNHTKGAEFMEMDTKIGGEMHVNLTEVRNAVGANGIELVHEITMDFWLKQDKKMTIHYPGRGSTTQIEFLKAEYSTKADYNGKNGKTGKLIIRVSVSDLGKLVFKTISSKEPTVYLTAKPEIEGNSLGSIFNWFDGHITKELKNVKSKVLESAAILKNLQDLNQTSQRVILPVSSVYAYRNIRIDGNVIFFDTTYEPHNA